MTLDDVRLLKEEIQRDLEFKQAELAEIEDEEARLLAAPSEDARGKLDVYLERISGLLDAVDVGHDFRISFRKDGEANRTNLLPPSGDDNELRGIARAMLLERARRRAECDGAVALVLVETLVPNEVE